MRSLRSSRKAEILKSKPARDTEQDENSNVKMCSKRPKPVNNGKQSKRRVLADQTNAGSDLNISLSNGRDIPNGDRPKRTPNLPAKFNDHILNLSTTRKSTVPIFSNTLLSKNKSTTKPESTNIDSLQTRTNSEPVKIVSRVNTRSRISSKAAKTATTDHAKSPKSVKKVTAEKCMIFNTVEPPTTDQIPVNLTTQKPVKIVKNVTPIYKKKFTLLEKVNVPTPDRMALYEFDFDPSEEPTKPKKKKVVRKATTKKKKVIPEGDAALQALIVQLKKIQETQKIKKLLRKKNNKNNILKPVSAEPFKQRTIEKVPILNVDNNLVQNALEAEQCIGTLSPVPRTRFCYSPRSPSPFENESSNVDKPAECSSNISSNVNLFNVTDMRRDSFFSDVPAASSSMIQDSAHKPAASPWRVNYDNEIRKWPCNFYVKASMTPSYERDTFHIIGLDDNANKTNEHNTVPERPTKYVNDSQKSSNLKQTSILSFYEESMKKTAKKRSHSPKKPTEPYNFDELNPSTLIKESSTEEIHQVTPEKTPPKAVIENPTLGNCFGFDDSAEYDQENVSPVKKPKIQNLNAIRRGGLNTLKKRGILREINPPVNIPTRAVVADVMQIIEKQKEEIVKVADVIAVVKEINTVTNQNAESDYSSNVEEDTVQGSTDNSQVSCENELALFEDPVKADEPKVVHYTKPSCRSYGRKKKGLVTFHLSPVDIDKEIDIDEESDYMSDSSTDTKVKAKKLVKKKKKQTAKTKKEEKEVDEWAAGFNSMLEEVDDFALCIE